MKATAEAARLTQAIRLPAANACSRRFDYDQAQLGTRSAIFAVGQHFVQGAPFAIPTAPGADLWDRLRARVPSEVATETLLCRRSYRQAVQSERFNRLLEGEPGFQHRRDILGE